MKKNLCILLLIGLCAIPFISKADSKQLLSRIPTDNESAVCICLDAKQINPFLQVMEDMIESSSLPPEGKAESKGLQKKRVEFLTSLKKDDGITPDDFGAICAILHPKTGSSKSSSSEQAMENTLYLALLETTLAEDVFLKFLRSRFDTTEELIDGHKVFVCKEKDAKKPSAAESPATETHNQKAQNAKFEAKIRFEYECLAGSPFIVTFLDDQTILIASEKETLKDYFAKINGGIQPARFLHQDDLSKNPALWICGDIPIQFNMKNPPDDMRATADKMDRNFHEAILYKLDKFSLSAFINTENEKSVSVNVFLKMTDDTAGPMFSSLISGFLTILFMSSDNPAAVAELINVKAVDKEVAVTVKINKMLLDTAHRFTDFAKAAEGSTDSDNKGLTITHEK